jgi:hypothetical protein
MIALRTCLLLEVLLFAAASLLHRGSETAVVEGVIGLVLVTGFAIAVYRPRAARTAALWAQGLALLGVAIGIAAIVTGVGPRTRLDYGIRGFMAILLLMGIAAARRVTGDPLP